MVAVPGAIALGLGILILSYRSAAFVGLGWVLTLGGLVAVVYGVAQVCKVRGVTSVDVICPYCQFTNRLTEKPMADFTCDKCHRSIPIDAGRVMRVWQVRCGYCNELNFYSEKSTGLICESCDHEIPIATDEEVRAKAVVDTFTVHEDTNLYDLFLTGRGMRSEEMLGYLQKLLALNRNQVKQVIEEMPALLLTGIPRKKAELLRSEIIAHGGKAEFRVMAERTPS